MTLYHPGWARYVIAGDDAVHLDETFVKAVLNVVSLVIAAVNYFSCSCVL